ncbi:MAG: hypothetical protein E7057_10355 [Lentisphaerae bacterium]|nr:hypothetical protein [Lentisphaerota bacterium]
MLSTYIGNRALWKNLKFEGKNSVILKFCKFLLCISAALCAGVLYAGELPSYEVTVTVECKNAAAAEKAQLKFLPLPPGKSVAFSCRWDDNNAAHPKMKKLMQKYGYKGTFYLLAPKAEFRDKVLPELCKDGFTIGNHTLHHYSLSQLTANGIFYEILAARIMLETLSGQTVTAFIFPGGSFDNRFAPEVPQIISSCLRRSGMLGGPDKATTRLNKLPGNEFFNTGGCNIYPGDRNTSCEVFDKHVAKSLPEAGKTAHLTLGIHVWHSEKDFAELEKSMEKYSARPEWWYCNENEFLAYSYMLHHAKVTGKKVDGSQAVFTVKLPYPENLGSSVPLWAECDGKNVAIRHTQGLPVRIGSAAPDGSCAEFPGLKAKISFPSADRVRFEVENSGKELENTRLMLRLPPDFSEEVIEFYAGKISGKFRKEWQVSPDKKRQSSGRRLTAVQMDFVRAGECGRLWTTHTQKIRSAVPVTAEIFCSSRKFPADELAKIALPETPADKTVFFPVSHQNNYLETIFKVPERAVNKESLTVVMDFDGGKEFTLMGNLPETVYLNGKKVETADGTLRFQAPSGKCRILFQHLNTRRPLRQIQLILKP